VEDVLSFDVTVRADDGTQSGTGTLTINIEDDRPTIVADYDAIIGNEPGNSLTAPLDISFGADGPNEDNPIQLYGPSLQDDTDPNYPDSPYTGRHYRMIPTPTTLIHLIML
jgi:hypothetical protein